MLEFNVNGNQGEFQVKLPTSLSELTPDYLTTVTKGINVAPNYSLVGLCYREKLSTIILSIRQRKKQIDTPVVPIFIKTGAVNDYFIESINIGNKLIIPGSDLAIGNHVSTPKNLITINNILELVEGDKDIYQEALANNEYCYFLEFKIVPNCAIKGYYNHMDVDGFDDPFVVKTASVEH